MTLEDAIKSIAARALTKPDADLSGCPQVDDLRDVLQKERPEFFVSGISQPDTDQLSQPRPVRPDNRRLHSKQLSMESLD